MREVGRGDDHGGQLGVRGEELLRGGVPGDAELIDHRRQDRGAAVADRHELGIGILLERPGEHAAADPAADDSDSC